MELRSTEKTYMASVSWIYPQDQLVALRRQNALADGDANLIMLTKNQRNGFADSFPEPRAT
jgi:type IV secretory pathway VirB9-like protein